MRLGRIINSIIIFILLINISSAQENTKTEAKVTFEVDYKLADINDEFEIYFVDNKDTIWPKIKQDSIITDTTLFKDSSYVTMFFKYKDYKLKFNKTSTDYIKNNSHYKFWYDKKPFSDGHSWGVNKFKTKYLYGIYSGGKGDGWTRVDAIEYKIFHIFK